MKLTKTFALAFSSILASKWRSFLTMLGIIIGISAVIVIVGIGNGLEQYMVSSFEEMGTNVLTVNIMGRGSTRSVSVDQMYEFADENTNYYSSMSPTVSLQSTAKVGTEELSSTTSTGVSEDYLELKVQDLESGRFLVYSDILNRSKTCVVGNYIDDTFFGGNAVGQSIKLDGNVFEIVGVVSETDDSSEGSGDDFIYVPYSTALNISGSGTISAYSFAMATDDQVDQSIYALENFLYQTFETEDAYRVISLASMLDSMTEMIDVLVLVLSIIAGISLLVGGIGIMNIMLVSVSERTREIGIRKALGAKRKNILTQFVIESGTTSAIGGVLGIILGYVFSSIGTTVITMLSPDTAIAVTPTIDSVIFAFAISAGIGILFGYLPAKKAAALNPIDALRYD